MLHLNEILFESSGFLIPGFNTAITTILSPGSIVNDIGLLPSSGVTLPVNTMIDFMIPFINKE
jgi:hypothetical protein